MTVYLYVTNPALSSNFPLEVTLREHRNSLKSIVPSPLESKVLNTCSANLEASPDDKKNYTSSQLGSIDFFLAILTIGEEVSINFLNYVSFKKNTRFVHFTNVSFLNEEKSCIFQNKTVP